MAELSPQSKSRNGATLFANFIHPLLHGIFGVQFTLGGFKASGHQSDRLLPHQRHRLMACLLKAFQAITMEQDAPNASCQRLDRSRNRARSGLAPVALLTLPPSVTWATSPRSCNCLIKLLLAIKFSMYKRLHLCRYTTFRQTRKKTSMQNHSSCLKAASTETYASKRPEISRHSQQDAA
ncbi:Uncharacterised protein [Raoultella planticola]|uniref:Uncharacterized protein n=1 Tax=Raoultella planticola TaxID=575 RepID=A0A485CZ37_RAOPL|nr:Uncharacterised protein [Raoultella planticola]